MICAPMLDEIEKLLILHDRDGKLRLVVGFGLEPEKIAADLRVLVRS